MQIYSGLYSVYPQKETQWWVGNQRPWPLTIWLFIHFHPFSTTLVSDEPLFPGVPPLRATGLRRRCHQLVALSRLAGTKRAATGGAELLRRRWQRHVATTPGAARWAGSRLAGLHQSQWCPRFWGVLCNWAQLLSEIGISNLGFRV